MLLETVALLGTWVGKQAVVAAECALLGLFSGAPGDRNTIYTSVEA
jgi:hypothetical protein